MQTLAAPHVALIVDTALGSGRGILRGITEYTRQCGAWITYHEPRDVEHHIPSWLNGWHGNGVIARVQNQHMRMVLEHTGLPVVDVLGAGDTTPFPLVHVDNAAISRLAADHLLDLGLSSFGFCHMEGLSWSAARLQAFESYLQENGYMSEHFNMTERGFSQFSYETEQAALADWLKQLKKPAGIMICSDWRGHAVLAACHRAGVRVPDDVALIGVDDDATLCEACEPDLSSVRCDYQRVGFEACRLLAALMNGEAPPTAPHFIPPTRITVRRSTDTLAIDEGPVARALRIIRECATTGITVEDVVHRTRCSRTALKRDFKAVVGRTMHEEILQVKLHEAMFLLRESDRPIAHIAEQTGFKSQAYLGAVLKAHHGITPLRYRKSASY